jgi:hypothetical protein
MVGLTWGWAQGEQHTASVGCCVRARLGPREGALEIVWLKAQ